MKWAILMKCYGCSRTKLRLFADPIPIGEVREATRCASCGGEMTAIRSMNVNDGDEK